DVGDLHVPFEVQDVPGRPGAAELDEGDGVGVDRVLDLDDVDDRQLDREPAVEADDHAAPLQVCHLGEGETVGEVGAVRVEESDGGHFRFLSQGESPRPRDPYFVFK